DVAADPDVPVALEVRRDLIVRPDERVRPGHAVMMLLDLGQYALGLGLRVADHEPAATVWLDLRWIATGVDAVLSQDLELARHRLGWTEAVPHVGVARRGAQRLLLSAAADHDRQAFLHGSRVQHRVLERVVLPLVRHALAVEQRADDLRSLREPARALAGRSEIDPVGLVLRLIPYGPDPTDRAAVRDLIQRRGDVRDDGRMAIGDARHHRPEANALRDRGESREDRPGFEVRPLLLAGERVEVVPGPNGVDADAV